jgi:hypothetical protein
MKHPKKKEDILSGKDTRARSIVAQALRIKYNPDFFSPGCMLLNTHQTKLPQQTCANKPPF